MYKIIFTIVLVADVILLVRLIAPDAPMVKSRSYVYQDTPLDVRNRDALTGEFDAYIAVFEKQYGATANINIRFEALPVGVVGYCYQKEGLITVDYNWWRDMSEGQRLEVILHELGHCLLDRRHNTDEDIIPTIAENGEAIRCPYSLMYPSVSSYKQQELCFDKKRQEYYDELFKGE
jgi:hypothetical protein